MLDAMKDLSFPRELKTGSNFNQNLSLQVGLLFELGNIADEAQ
jgi:hypothetical protein